MYNVIRETPNSNPVVKELNAAVLSATFKGEETKGDLYRVVGSCDKIVCHGSCPPVNSTFIRTIELDFSQLG